MTTQAMTSGLWKIGRKKLAYTHDPYLGVYQENSSVNVFLLEEIEHSTQNSSKRDSNKTFSC